MTKSSPLLSFLESDQSKIIKQGAEAKIYVASVFPDDPIILKHRFPKTYRHATLDKQLTRSRLNSETKCLVRAFKSGVSVPGLRCLDLDNGVLGLELIQGKSVRELLGAGAEGELESESATTQPALPIEQLDEDSLMKTIGRQIAKLHKAQIIHGDLTTSNMMVREPFPSPNSNSDGSTDYDLVMIDFGLAYVSSLLEDKAVDLYVLQRAFLSTHPDTPSVHKSNRFDKVLQGYAEQLGEKDFKPLLKRFQEVTLRGRKRSMVG